VAEAGLDGSRRRSLTAATEAKNRMEGRNLEGYAGDSMKAGAVSKGGNG
jgi:hypothetical protein